MSPQHDDPVDHEMAALVATDRASSPPPDLAALRAGGRRRLRRQRAALAAAASAVVLAVGVPVAVLAGDDRAGPDRGPVATPDASPSSAPTSAPTTPATDAPPVTTDRRGEVPIPGGGSLVGTWEDGTVLGDVVRVGRVHGYPQVVYAAENRRSAGTDRCVSVGVRVDGRILRLLCAVTEVASGDVDGYPMWGGAALEDAVEPSVPGAGYLLLGVVPGDTEVSVVADDADPRPPTGRRTDILPGHTVFYDEAPWQDGWDPLRLAPLTVTTGSGLTLSVPERSYVS